MRERLGRECVYVPSTPPRQVRVQATHPPPQRAPPLDDFAGPEFVEPSPAPEAARWFAAHALPVDPLLARRMMRLLQREAPQSADPFPGPSLRDQAPRA